MALHDIERKKLEKRLLKRMKRNELSLVDAVNEMKKKRIEPSRKFCQDLYGILKVKIEKNAAEIEKKKKAEEERNARDVEFKKSRFGRQLEKAIRESEEKKEQMTLDKFPNMKDNKVWRQNKHDFNVALGKLRKGEINERDAEQIGKKLGLNDYSKWWERYYQFHIGFVYKKKAKRE